MENHDRELGSLDARMTIMESRMTSLEGKIDQRLQRLETSLSEVHAAVISARGAWKAISWIAGITGVVAAAVSFGIHWLAKK